MGIILVGLDGSPRSPAVLQAAVDLAQRGGQRLVLFRSFGIPPEMPSGIWRNDGSVVENIRGAMKDYLSDCASTVPSGIVAEIRVEVGVPWKELCATAAGMQADMIVIGSHGYTAVDRLVGTTAAKVVNHAECSVLVVRARPDASAPPVTPA
jgi:universal stress protein F